jgi:hypothetical protein
LRGWRGRRCGVARGWGRRARRYRRRRGRRRRTGGQESQRVEVAVRIAVPADAEVDIRARPLGRTGRAQHPHPGTLLDRRVPLDGDRSEVGQRDGVAVVRSDRDREPARRHRGGKGDHAAVRRNHCLSGRARDVDPSMLPAEIGVGTKAERPQDGSRYRPAPRSGARRQHERGEGSESGRTHSRQHAFHGRELLSVLSILVTDSSRRRC